MFFVVVVYNRPLCDNLFYKDTGCGLSRESLTVIYTMAGSWNIVLFVFLFKWGVNVKNLICTSLFPGALCICIRLTFAVPAVGIIILGLILAYSLVIVAGAVGYIRRKPKTAVIFHALYRIIKMANVLILIPAIIPALIYVTRDKVESSRTIVAVDMENETGLWEANRDQFIVFLRYDILDEESKLEALQLLSDYEAEYLG